MELFRTGAGRVPSSNSTSCAWVAAGGTEYETGLALFALHRGADRSPDDEVYQSGTAFLLDTQCDDGSWHVKSRTRKFQPYFESGFPHGHDQWISAAATAWASMALMFTLDT